MSSYGFILTVLPFIFTTFTYFKTTHKNQNPSNLQL